MKEGWNEGKKEIIFICEHGVDMSVQNTHFGEFVV